MRTHSSLCVTRRLRMGSDNAASELGTNNETTMCGDSRVAPCLVPSPTEDVSIDPQQGDSFFGLGTIDKRTVLHGLKAGEKHQVEIRLSNKEFIARGAPFSTRGGIRLAAIRKVDPEQGIQAAVELAKSSDRKILFKHC